MVLRYFVGHDALRSPETGLRMRTDSSDRRFYSCLIYGSLLGVYEDVSDLSVNRPSMIRRIWSAILCIFASSARQRSRRLTKRHASSTITMIGKLSRRSYKKLYYAVAMRLINLGDGSESSL